METIIKDIGLVKNKIISPIQDSVDIQETLLNGTEFSEEYWYGNDEDEFGIIYKQIFPYLFIDETQTDVKAYICCEVDLPRIPNNTMKDLVITIWCICHKDIMKCIQKGYSGTRADILADEVEKALRGYELELELDGKAAYGIGKLELSSVKSMTSINSKFYGRSLTFTIPDFKFKGR